jgi:hypothetical protein
MFNFPKAVLVLIWLLSIKITGCHVLLWIQCPRRSAPVTVTMTLHPGSSHPPPPKVSFVSLASL